MPPINTASQQPGAATPPAQVFTRAVRRAVGVRGFRADYFDHLASRTSQMSIEDQKAIDGWFEDILGFLRRMDVKVYERGRVKARLGVNGIGGFLDELYGGRASIGQRLKALREEIFGPTPTSR